MRIERGLNGLNGQWRVVSCELVVGADLCVCPFKVDSWQR